MSDQRISERYNIQKRLYIYPERTIYLAEDKHRFNEYCVLQEYSTYTPELEQAAKILYKIKNPQIVTFREIFSSLRDDKEYIYLVEDYIPGFNYQELAKEYQSKQIDLGEAEILEILKQILLILEVFHKKGIVHGSLTPNSLIESEKLKKPILVNFNQHVRYDPSTLLKDIIDLTAVINLFVGTDRQLSPQFLNLLQLMRQGKFSSATSLLKAIEKFTINPSFNEPSLVTSLPASDDAQSSSKTEQSTMIISEDSKNPDEPVYKQKKRSPLLSCLSKVFLILMLSAGAGAAGWLAGKWWINSRNPTSQITNNTSNQTSPLATPTSMTSDNSSPLATPSGSISPIVANPAITPSVSNDLAIRQRLLALNITDDTFFKSLVDQIYSNLYPQEKNVPTDPAYQRQWNQIAEEVLDYLNQLKPEALKNLGKYNANDINRWAQESNKLHLSSRTLFKLADSQFSSWFSGQPPQTTSSDQPLAQLRNALIYSQLISLQSGANYEKLTNLSSQVSGTLQSGMGQAYTIRLTKGRPLQINLIPANGIQVSIYSPTGKNNLFEDSSTGQWSGQLPESGYYEIILINPSKTAIPYTLKIN